MGRVSKRFSNEKAQIPGIQLQHDNHAASMTI